MYMKIYFIFVALSELSQNKEKLLFAYITVLVQQFRNEQRQYQGVSIKGGSSGHCTDPEVKTLSAGRQKMPTAEIS